MPCKPPCPPLHRTITIAGVPGTVVSFGTPMIIIAYHCSRFISYRRLAGGRAGSPLAGWPEAGHPQARQADVQYYAKPHDDAAQGATDAVPNEMVQK